MKFRFDKEKHEYWLGDTRLPSVTEIIEPLYNFEGIPEDVLERKKQLGLNFHEAIRLHFLDDLLFDSLDPDLVKPMETFINWSHKNLIHRIVDNKIKADIEIPLYHKSLYFAGTPDLILPDDLYDWKLRPYNRLVDTLQLTGYDHMAEGKARRKWTVCFDIDGKITVRQSRNIKAWGIFRRMLERYYSEQKFYNLLELWKGMN